MVQNLPSDEHKKARTKTNITNDERRAVYEELLRLVSNSKPEWPSSWLFGRSLRPIKQVYKPDVASFAACPQGELNQGREVREAPYSDLRAENE